MTVINFYDTEQNKKVDYLIRFGLIRIRSIDSFYMIHSKTKVSVAIFQFLK